VRLERAFIAADRERMVEALRHRGAGASQSNKKGEAQHRGLARG